MPSKLRSHSVLNEVFEILGMDLGPRMTILEKQTMLTERISQVKKARPASLSNHQVLVRDDIIKDKSISALALIDSYELYLSCNKSVFRCSLKRDGIGLVAIRVDHVVDVQYKIVGLCVLNGNLFIPTSNLVQTYSFENGSVVTEDFRARSLCSFRGGLLFTIKDWNNIRLYSPSKSTTEDLTLRDLQVSKSSTSGLVKPCSFGKVIGLAVEFDVNIFVTDSRAAAVKLLTTVSGT